MQEIKPNYTRKELFFMRQKCPHCEGTGLEYEEARKLWNRKDIKDLTYAEFTWIFSKKFRNDEIEYIGDAKLTTKNIIEVLKARDIWIECARCKGRGIIK